MPVSLQIKQDLGALKKIIGEIPKERTRYVRDTADQIIALAKKKMSVPYPPAGKKNDYPAMRTGDLKDSLKKSRARTIGSTTSIYVMSDIYYSKFVEMGTRFMSPRPFLRLSSTAVARNHKRYAETLFIKRIFDK